MVEGNKMSKSLGNLYTLADIIKKGYSSSELRFALLAGSYRTKLNFSFERMDEARLNLRRIANLAHNLGGIDSYDNLCELAQNDFIEMGPFQASWNALFQDLNASASLGELFGAIKSVEGKLAGQDICEEDRKIYKQGLSTIVNAFGWDLPDADSENKDIEVPEQLQLLANQRWEAKNNKEWAESDRLRDEINSHGWIIKDEKEGYKLEPETN